MAASATLRSCIKTSTDGMASTRELSSPGQMVRLTALNAFSAGITKDSAEFEEMILRI